MSHLRPNINFHMLFIRPDGSPVGRILMLFCGVMEYSFQPLMRVGRREILMVSPFLVIPKSEGNPHLLYSFNTIIR